MSLRIASCIYYITLEREGEAGEGSLFSEIGEIEHALFAGRVTLHDKIRGRFETKDADGPLLDTTLALYGSGMSYGHSHGNANLPIVFAGGTKLGFKHGRHLDLNRAAGLADYQLGNPREHYRDRKSTRLNSSHT